MPSPRRKLALRAHRPLPRRLTTGALTALILAAVAATAHALPDVGEETGADTRRTPVAKAPPDGLFTQVAGAKYDGPQAKPENLIENSPTPFEAELLDVAFEKKDGDAEIDETKDGFAGGTHEREDGTKVPVIYRHRDDDGIDVWEESARFDDEGYVAAITWLPGGRALAVGGDGDYPHRETSASYCAPGEPPPIEGDPAGKVRAWLYESGSWRELSQKPDGTSGDELPDAMGALTALDAYDNTGELKGIEFAVAGGLCQLWHWTEGEFMREDDGSFAEPFSPRSPREKLFTHAFIGAERFPGAQNFAYRVRSVESASYGPDQQGPLRVKASTSGCCAPDSLTEAQKKAIVLDYLPPKEEGVHPARGAWIAPSGNKAGAYNTADEVTSELVVGSAWGLLRFSYEFTRSQAQQNGAPGSDELPPFPDQPDVDPGLAENEALPDYIDGEARELRPDSYYSVMASAASATVIAAPGGATSDSNLEPASEIGSAGLVPSTTVASTRLLDGDGDIGGGGGGDLPPISDGPSTFFLGEGLGGDRARDDPDRIPDWAVGELTAKGQAAVVSTYPALVEEPDPAVKTPPSDGLAEAVVDGYEPTDAERATAATRSYSLLKLPTYGLRAIEVIDQEGVGWAVGEHGAIVRLRVDMTEVDDRLDTAKPPRLGSRRPERLPDASAYDAVRPARERAEAGEVPALAARPPEDLDRPELRSFGAPQPLSHAEDVQQIAMSRDGSEGWAVGPEVGFGSEETTLFHFEGARWSRCDPSGVAGQLLPDADCGDLVSLYEDEVVFSAISRLPLERDSDPTNDDEFEAIAIGTDRAVIGYRNGRWRIEDSGIGTLPSTSGPVEHLAFTAPDDGWALDSSSRLLHFDGERWMTCRDAPGNCYDAGPQESRRLYGGPNDFRLEGVVAAGDRVYAYGQRSIRDIANASNRNYPLIVYRERGAERWEGGDASGGHDPAHGRTQPGQEPPTNQEGTVHALAVAGTSDGTYSGWAIGRFGVVRAVNLEQSELRAPESGLMRLTPGEGWRRFTDSGVLARYSGSASERIAESSVAMSLDRDGTPQALIGDRRGRVLGFDEGRDRWQILPTGRPPNGAQGGVAGQVQAIAADGAGGAWVAVLNSTQASGGVTFYRYAHGPPVPVFEEVPNPIRDPALRITDLEGAADGTVWLSTDSSSLYRYDRILGWTRAQIPGWDPGAVVTRASEVNAIALAEDGEGIAVGPGGRIADLSPDAVQLDVAAGTACELAAPLPPCGTAHDLLTAAIAPDGSALAAGEARSLLWRPAGGEFRSIPPPPVPRTARFVASSMPAPGRAWLVTHEGRIYGGRDAGAGEWIWRLETIGPSGNDLGLDARARPIAVNDIALDRSGHGYAVGQRGLILERSGDAEHPWSRVDSGFLDHLTKIALPAGGGEGALAGGRNGLILTRDNGRFQIARPTDFEASAPTGPVAGLALLPGVADGQAEAWTALDDDGGADVLNRLLHFASDREEPLLDPVRRAAALPDAPPPRAGELSFAVFGKTECSMPVDKICHDVTGSIETAQVVTERIREEVLARAARDGGPGLALFTGDTVDSAALPASSELTSDVPITNDGLVRQYFSGPAKLRSWSQRIADRLDDEGTPLLGAIGSQDLSETVVCDDLDQVPGIDCVTTKQEGEVGDNRAWRVQMEERPAPWGEADSVDDSRYGFEPVGDPAEGTATGPIGVADVDLGDPDRDGDVTTAERVSAGQARTHYAVDVLDGGDRVARIVVADNSLRSFAASDAQQQPLEPQGQLAWLERMLCRAPDRAPTGERCTREEGQAAVVVANTPTYSYGPGAIADTATTDAATFEATLLRHHVSAVVSGRIGWNGLYYALAPGLHWPCPGGDYPQRAPKPGQAPDCTGDDVSGSAGAPDANAPSLEDATDLSGLLPFVVASGGGGKFAEGAPALAEASASEGFWHGYSIIRLARDGDPAETIVEQRPIYDWIAILGGQRTLRPGQRSRLGGIGRGPIAVTIGQQGVSNNQRARLDTIESPAVTHRFDLVLAYPDEPWLPLPTSQATPAQLSAAAKAQVPHGVGSPADSNPCEPYVCLDPQVGKIDDQTGQVKSGKGNYPLTFAIAMLSVGDHVATYPLAFEPSPSFRAQPPAVPRPNFAGASVTPPAAPAAPSAPQVPNVSVPQPPVPPALVPPPPAPPATPPQPPVPPPVPPADAGPSPLSLSFAPTGLVVAPTASVIPPPAPPINPAPPGGARREARQRQAATQKSGADGGEQAKEDGVDLAEGPPTARGSSEMTRLDHEAIWRDRRRAEPSMTALAPGDQPSAWSRGALYGGGIAVSALALALAYGTLRPTPRRRAPTLPAPAVSRVTRSRR